jgi:hypothetical protein
MFCSGWIQEQGAWLFEGDERHRADMRNTAVISPYMRFGELSPRYK